MKISLDKFYILGSNNTEHAEIPANLLKNFLFPGTIMWLGRKSGMWYWNFEFPTNLNLPSAIVCLTNDHVPNKYVEPNNDGWVVLKRPHSKDQSEPYSRTIKSISDFPLESLYSLTDADFAVRMEIARRQDAILGIKGGAIQMTIWSNVENISKQIAIWLNSTIMPFDNRHTNAYQVQVSLPELHYMMRIPVYSDSYMPHLHTGVSDVIKYISQNPDSLTRNLLVAGLPGSGKTTTVKRITHSLLRSSSIESLFIADVKGEYEEWALQNKVQFISIGRDPTELKQLGLNLFMPSQNVRLGMHIQIISLLLSVGNFGGAGSLLPPYISIFLEEYYCELLLHKIDANDWCENDYNSQRLNLLNLTGAELLRRMNGNLNCFQYSNRGLSVFWKKNANKIMQRLFGEGGLSNSRHEIMDVISTRLAGFETSILQYLSYDSTGESIDKLLSEKWCLSLNGLSKSDIQLILATVTMLSFEALMAGDEKQRLAHLFVLEECHIVASQTAASEEIMTIDRTVGQIVERALSTARSKGVGYILTDQQPGTRLMPSIMANTNMKVCHNLLGKDAELMSNVMGLSADTALNLLGVGEAYVKLGDASLPLKIRVRL